MQVDRRIARKIHARDVPRFRAGRHIDDKRIVGLRRAVAKACTILDERDGRALSDIEHRARECAPRDATARHHAQHERGRNLRAGGDVDDDTIRSEGGIQRHDGIVVAGETLGQSIFGVLAPLHKTTGIIGWLKDKAVTEWTNLKAKPW